MNPAHSVRPAVTKAIAALEAANDMDGLKKLRGEFVVKQEGQRMRYARNRSTKNGDTYLRTGRELGEIINEGALQKGSSSRKCNDPSVR